MKTQGMFLSPVVAWFILGNTVGFEQIGSAQQTIPANEPAQAVTAANNSDSAEALAKEWRTRNEELKQELLKPIELTLSETPLEEVVRLLEDRHGFEIQIDNRALETLGLDRSLPITIHLSAVPLRAALDASLSEHELTHYTRDGILFITSNEEAENKAETRVYKVQSLLNPDQPLESREALRKVITSIVAPDTWEEVGGYGSIAAYQMTLIVRQTEPIHESIANLLNELGQIVTSAGGPKLPVVQRRGKAHPLQQGRLERGEQVFKTRGVGGGGSLGGTESGGSGEQGGGGVF